MFRAGGWSSDDAMALTFVRMTSLVSVLRQEDRETGRGELPVILLASWAASRAPLGQSGIRSNNCFKHDQIIYSSFYLKYKFYQSKIVSGY